MLKRTMPDPLAAVKERMKELGWTTYRLVKELDGKIPAVSVYEFLRGKTKINSDSLGIIMDAVGLEFAAKRKGGK